MMSGPASSRSTQTSALSIAGDLETRTTLDLETVRMENSQLSGKAHQLSVTRKRTAIVVSGYWGQMSAGELTQAAADGHRPRKDYVELANLLDADIIDGSYMAKRSGRIGRLIGRRIGFSAGQVAESLVHRRDYQRLCVWSDRIGLPLAVLQRFTRTKRDLVLIAAWPVRKQKAFLLKRLKAYRALRVIINDSATQMELLAACCDVPREKLSVWPIPVDERFWHPLDRSVENIICAVGSEERDYPTMIAASRDLDVTVEFAVGTIDASPKILTRGEVGGLRRRIEQVDLPPNIQVSSLKPFELRELYARSRFVVVPVHDVPFAAGITAVTEAMAMGKAVIVTRTREMSKLLTDGVQGILVPPGDPVALRGAIERLLAHADEAERMGREGRKLVEQRHTMDACITYLADRIRAETSG